MTDLGAWVRARPWAGDLALAVLVAVPVGASTLSLLDQSHLTSTRYAWLVVAVAVLHATVAMRRVAPVPAFAVATVVEGLLLAIAPLAIRSGGTVDAYPAVLVPSSVCLALLLYAVAAHAGPLWRLAALGVAVAGAGIAVARLATAGDPGTRAVLDGGWEIAGAAVGLVVAVLAAWTLGTFRRLHSGYAEALRREEAFAAVRDERVRVAHELHDVIAHSLAVVVRQADAGRYLAQTDPARAQQILDTVASTGRAALGDMRSLLGVLRTGDEERGPSPTSADVPELVERLRGSGQPATLDVTLDVTGAPVALTSAGELAVYRVVQEALTNVVKHAGANAAASVVLAWDERGVLVTVTDDGGRGRRRPVAAGGHGLAGLRERLTLLGGTLDAGPHGPGHRLAARIPAAP